LNVYGYAFSDNETNDKVQIKALKLAQCDHIYSDTCGKRTQRKELLPNLHPGDTLIIWRLDKLVDSVAELQNLLTQFDGENVALKTIQEKINHSFQSDKLCELVSAMAKIEKKLISSYPNLSL